MTSSRSKLARRGASLAGRSGYALEEDTEGGDAEMESSFDSIADDIDGMLSVD